MLENKYIVNGINIEVTNRCPLHCPQCYCSLDDGNNIDIKKVYQIIIEASKMCVSHIEFSGGETLCYPYIFDAISFAEQNDIATSISISGWSFNEKIYDKLVMAGISGIHISLNATTEVKNKLSRDGYYYAIQALDLLKQKKFSNTTINWVMHRETVDELPKMIKLAEEYNVSSILIIDPKPNSKKELNTYPTSEQMTMVAQIIKENTSSVDLDVHHCFSSLAALVGRNKLWGNLNRGFYKGCTAAICSVCVSVDGKLSPCRHLEYYENFDTIGDYWNNSQILEQIREVYEKEPSEPCKGCSLMNYCRHCLAINTKLENKIYRGNKHCPIGKR